MQNAPVLLEQNYLLIKKIFSKYCLQQKAHLTSTTQKLLFKKLLQNIYRDWTSQTQTLQETTPKVAALVEITRLHCQRLLKDNHTIDLVILQTQPTELVVKYQRMIAHIVNKQAKQSTRWDFGKEEDLIAQIRENLLRKIANGKLTRQFKGETAFHNYLYRVIYHSMIDELRKRSKENRITSIDELPPKEETHYAVVPDEMAYTEWVEQHLQWLEALIRAFPIQKQRRFEFALMVVYRLQLKASDVQSLYENCGEDLLVEILSYFSRPYHDISLAELYKLLSTFVVLLEKQSKNIRAEAFRVWFQTRLKQVKRTLFKRMPSAKNTSLDRYFELLVYKLYERN